MYYMRLRNENFMYLSYQTSHIFSELLHMLFPDAVSQWCHSLIVVCGNCYLAHNLIIRGKILCVYINIIIV